MDKFGRTYLLSIQKIGLEDQLDIELPLTIDFDIVRKSFSSANHASIRIYNLSADHRNQLRKNVFNWGDQRVVQLRAGYGKNNPIIFQGNIYSAYSEREGVDFITTIESHDGGFAFQNSQTSTSFPADSTTSSVILNLVSSLKKYGVDPGAVGEYQGSISRGNAYVGSTVSILTELTNQGFFIDNGKVYCLGTNEVIQGDLAIIEPDTGLLNTPILQETRVTLDMIFEPRLKVGQLVTLNSFTADKGLNQDYKVIGLQHKGMISDAVCGQVVTSVELFSGTQLLKLVSNL